jgi:AcrR family transcriptional regulator
MATTSPSLADSEISTVGRPRDPDVDRRIFDAAMDVFGEFGWKGFSVAAVARRANVGKASIYLRWPNKTDLLIDAVRARVAGAVDTRCEDVRSELLALARHLLRQNIADSGRSSMRLSLEAHLIPGLSEYWDEVCNSQVAAARAIVKRAIARGELPRGTSVTLVLDTLSGATLMNARATPAGLREKRQATVEVYAEKLVDFVLTAARAQSEAPVEPVGRA